MHYGRTPMSWEITDFDIDFYPAWVRTPTHTEPVMTPLYCEFWYGIFMSGMRKAADYMKLPTTMGYLWKLYKGHGYLTCALPRKEDIPKREEIYRKRSAAALKDVDKAVKANHKELDDLIKPYLYLEPDKMEDYELLIHVHDMIKLHADLNYAYFRGWYQFSPWVLAFQTLIQEVAGIKPTDVEYSHLLGGYYNLLYDSNAQLGALAKSAVENNLDAILLKTPLEEVIPAMQQSKAGKKWVEQLQDFLHVHGFRVMRHYEFCEPGWYEDPTLVIQVIRQYAEAGGGKDMDAEHKQRIKEREEAEAKLMSQVPSGKKQQLQQLLGLARACTYWLETANWYCELRRMAVGRRCFMECGRRMAADGVIESPDDIWMLFTDEVIYGVINHEKGAWLSLVKDRRQEFDHYTSLTPNFDEIPLALGDPNRIPELLQTDVTLAVAVSRPSEEDPDEVGALLTGGSGAPGVVEGIVRLVSDETQWNTVKSGDIMVCPMTSSTWTPLFAIINGLVTDAGGDLSHPVIVSREYGIPAVCGTNFATKKLKTGDRVRIDGDRLRVYKLD